jgi:membrane-bound serine protease (ClpP class)
VAQTDLRPSGTALILGDFLDVISEGEFISQGNRIEVLEANPLKIIVRPVNETQKQ